MPVHGVENLLRSKMLLCTLGPRYRDYTGNVRIVLGQKLRNTPATGKTAKEDPARVYA